MKRLVVKEEITTDIAVEDISTSKYYGVFFAQNSKGSRHGFIAFDCEEHFIVLRLDNLTNGINGRASHSLLQLITDLIDHTHTSVYQFDAYQELLEWLAE